MARELCCACGRDLRRALDLIKTGAKLLRTILPDPLGDWIAAECDLSDEGPRMRSVHLYAAFGSWLEQQGLSAADWSMTRFGRQLSQGGFAIVKDGHGRKVRLGIRVRALHDDLDNHAQGATDRSRARPAKPAADISLPFDEPNSVEMRAGR